MTDHQLTSMRSSNQMATSTEDPTLIDEIEMTDAGSQEMAAARLAVEVIWSLRRAMSESGMSQRKLGELLDLSPSAVSQVVNGDGNLRVVTIGRYFRALGYQPRLFLEPVEPNRRVIASRSTCHVIQNEFREYAELALRWSSEPPVVATPSSDDWGMHALPAGTAWQRVQINLGSASAGRRPETVSR